MFHILGTGWRTPVKETYYKPENEKFHFGVITSFSPREQNAFKALVDFIYKIFPFQRRYNVNRPKSNLNLIYA